jgi:capsular polysaccharide biosynthesis protein
VVVPERSVDVSSGGLGTPRPTGGRHALDERGGIARLWRLLSLPLLATVLGAAAGVAVSLVGGPQWEAQSTVVYTPPSQDPVVFPGANPAAAEREVADAAALAASEAVLAPAASRLGDGQAWTDLQEAVTVTPSPGSGVITVSVTATEAEEVAARLAAVVSSFADVARQQAVDAANMAAAAAAAGGTAGSDGGAAEDVRARAEVLARTADPVRVLSTTTPVQTAPSVPRDAATGGVLGLILAAGLLAVRAARPSRVSSARDAGEMFGLPVGVIRAGQVVPGSERLVEDLQRLGGPGTGHRLVVVPAGVASVAAAQEVAAVLRDTIPAHRPADEHVPLTDGGTAVDVGPAENRVRVTADPTTTVIAPALLGATAVVLAVEKGAPLREVRTVHRLSRHWERPPDAVVVTG